LNSRPLVPQTSALTGLRYAPTPLRGRWYLRFFGSSGNPSAIAVRRRTEPPARVRFSYERYEEQQPVIARLREACSAALAAAFVFAGAALGQNERSWVDPPGGMESPPSAERRPGAEARDGGMTSATRRSDSSQEQAARQLAVDYLDFWSAPNALTLEIMPDFYGPRVEFHGRAISADALMQEKRRFVRRWPVRSYTARIDTLRASCAPAAQTCTVSGLFDFTAISPERGRRSQGAANLELQVSFAGERPAIVSETSRVVSRGRTRAAGAFDEIED
jgi:hypothetical protein